MPDDFDVDAFLDGYERRVERVTVCARGDLLAEHSSLEAQLAEAGRGDDPDAAKHLAQRIAEIEEQIRASEREFTFQAISHEGWYRLLVEHPPTDEERAKRPEVVGGEDFQIAATAACSVSPKLTQEQVGRMRTILRPDDFDRLWMAVVRCNEGATVAPKSGLATAVRDLYAKLPTTSEPTASRGRRSSAGSAGRSRRTSTTKKAG